MLLPVSLIATAQKSLEMEPTYTTKKSDTVCDLANARISSKPGDNRDLRQTDTDLTEFNFDDELIGSFMGRQKSGGKSNRRHQIVQSFQQLLGKDLPKVGVLAGNLYDYIDDWSLGIADLKQIRRVAVDSLLSFNSENERNEWAILEWHRIYHRANRNLNSLRELSSPKK